LQVSDLITEFIKNLLSQQGGVCEIQRNELASTFSCVPSQINYVISTRFSPEYGYMVESKRGGGGYIKISRIATDSRGKIMHIINFIGDKIDGKTARIFVRNMFDEGLLKENEAKLLLSALSDNSLSGIPVSQKDALRAKLFKNMLLNLL